MRLPNRQLRRVIHRDMLHRGQRRRAAQLNVAHVADIEDAHAGAYGKMLGGQAGIFDRHVPTAKVDHLRAELAMGGVQGGLAENGSRYGAGQWLSFTLRVQP